MTRLVRTPEEVEAVRQAARWEAWLAATALQTRLEELRNVRRRAGAARQEVVADLQALAVIIGHLERTP